MLENRGMLDSVISDIMGGVLTAHKGGGLPPSPSTKFKIDEKGEERGNETEICSAKCDNLMCKD